jgi:hypothetical protein
MRSIRWSLRSPCQIQNEQSEGAVHLHAARILWYRRLTHQKGEDDRHEVDHKQDDQGDGGGNRAGRIAKVGEQRRVLHARSSPFVSARHGHDSHGRGRRTDGLMAFRRMLMAPSVNEVKCVVYPMKVQLLPPARMAASSRNTPLASQSPLVSFQNTSCNLTVAQASVQAFKMRGFRHVPHTYRRWRRCSWGRGRSGTTAAWSRFAPTR